MGFSRIKECLDLVIFCLSSISLQLPLPPRLLSFCIFMCVHVVWEPTCLLRLPSAIPTIKQQMTTSLLRPFKIGHKKGCCSYINLQQPPNRPLWVLYLSASLSSLLSAVTHPPPTPPPPRSASLRASVEIRSSLSEVLCHVAQGAWNSPRAVEQTQAQGLSIAAPQTNCLSNEPPSLSCPHTHTCSDCDFHTLACAHTFDSKGSDTLLKETARVTLLCLPSCSHSRHPCVFACVCVWCSRCEILLLLRGAQRCMEQLMQPTHPTHPTVYQPAIYFSF